MRRTDYESCPEVFVDLAAPESARIVLTDDSGAEIRMSAEQFRALTDRARAGTLEAAVQ
jgi:hypothetical protein